MISPSPSLHSSPPFAEPTSLPVYKPRAVASRPRISIFQWESCASKRIINISVLCISSTGLSAPDFSLLSISLSLPVYFIYLSLYRSLGSLSISSFLFLVHAHLSLLLHGMWGMRRRRKGERQVRKGQKRKGDLSAATHRCGCRWDGGTDEGPRGIVRPHLDCRLSLYCREIAGTLSPRRRPGAVAGNKCGCPGLIMTAGTRRRNRCTLTSEC